MNEDEEKKVLNMPLSIEMVEVPSPHLPCLLVDPDQKILLDIKQRSLNVEASGVMAASAFMTEADASNVAGTIRSMFAMYHLCFLCTVYPITSNLMNSLFRVLGIECRTRTGTVS
jgi:hypothetical protein